MRDNPIVRAGALIILASVIVAIAYAWLPAVTR